MLLMVEKGIRGGICSIYLTEFKEFTRLQVALLNIY